MSSTVLFSAVDDVAVRHALSVAEVRAFFAHHGLSVGSSGVVTQLAARLEDPAFTEDLVSMLRVVCADEPSISYLELLGLLLAAAGADTRDASLQKSSEGDARQLFNFLVERRRAMKAELETVPFAPTTGLGDESFFRPESSSYASYDSLEDDDGDPELTPASWSQAGESLWPSSDAPHPAAAGASGSAEKANAALARALALSADEASLPPLPAPAASRPAPLATAPSRPEEASTPRPHTPAVQPGSRSYRAWLAGACGLLLGLLLGLFGGLLLHHHPSPASVPAVALVPAPTSRPAQPAHHLQGRPAPATAAAPHTIRPSGRLAVRPADPLPKHARPATAPAASSGAAVAAPAEPSGPAPTLAGLGDTPAATLHPRAVREVRLGSPVDLSTASSRGFGRPRVFVGSAGIMAAYLISSPVPTYPAQASAAHVQGEVVIEAVVARDGSVKGTRVISGPPSLRQAALSAVERWRYRPYEVDGEASEIATTARLSFQLDGQ